MVSSIVAHGIYERAMEKVRCGPKILEGQQFPIGARVKITDCLRSSMAHFPSGKNATVKYVYAQAYGGGDVKSYCLDIDGIGEVSWYEEHQLKLIT